MVNACLRLSSGNREDKMEIKTPYFIKICYNLDEYVEFISNLTHDDIKTKLISVFEKDDKIILTFKEVYSVL